MKTAASIHRIAEKGCSRKPGFRCTEFSETQFVLLLILGSPIYKGNSMRSVLGLCTNARTTFRCTGFSETRTAPVVLHQDREVLPPSHRTGRQLYTMSFRHTEFSETQGIRRAGALNPRLF